MTAASIPAAAALDPVSKGALDLDWKRVGSFGGYGALGLVTIALSGMLVGLDPRAVIDGYLSMGYLAMIWLPVALGYSVMNETVLEGMVATARGARDLVAGAVVGAISGVGVGVLILLVDNFDLRDPLVNWSPQLLDQLTFDQSIGFGLVAWVVLCAALGAAGAGLHLLSDRVRRIVTIAILTVLGVSIFESILVDIFDIDAVVDFFYAPRGGLTLTSAAVLAVLAVAITIGSSGRTGQVKQRIAEMEPQQQARVNYGLIALAAVALIVVPQFTGKITNELLANVGIFLLLALGLNIVVGLAGILDLGYVAFFAVGGYTTAVLTSPNSTFLPTLCDAFGGECEPASLHWLVVLPIVVIMAGLTGLFIGAPVIRMRGDYLAIVTLGFGEIIRLLFLSDWLNGYFGGAQGVTNIPPADFGLFEVKGTSPLSVFYLVLFFSLIAIYVSWRLERSRLGRAWMAIREDESVAEAMGINTVNVKLMAFVVGAILASFGGAIFATKVGSIFPTSFLILVSIIILVVVIVGGIGNIAGVIVGAIVLIGVLGGPRQPGLLQEFSEYKLLIYGALLIWMMLKRPEGLVPNVRRTRELHQEEFLQDAWLKGEVDDAREGTADAEPDMPNGGDGRTPGAEGEVAPA